MGLFILNNLGFSSTEGFDNIEFVSLQ